MCWPAIVAAAVAWHGCSYWSACGEQPTTLPVCGEVWVLAAVLVAVAVLVLLSLMVVATVVAVRVATYAAVVTVVAVTVAT